jgi:threonine synthase
VTGASPLFVCHGCGAVVDPGRTFPFACPAAREGDDIDHVLVAPEQEQDDDRSRRLPLTRRPSAATLSPRERDDPFPLRGKVAGDSRSDEGPPRQPTQIESAFGHEDEPFLRYRRWLSSYRLARAVGLSDAAWFDIVGELDEALRAVDVCCFRRTPFARRPGLAAALGLAGPLWIKDETGNVSGSHKGRHLMGLMLYLRVLEISRLPLGADLRARRLAIASCGNAALAAAVIARGADWPLDVFIPNDAERSVVRRLRELGANVEVCKRRPSETGDPCVHAARRAVRRGAIPFGVQGPDNGLAVEGARTLAFEMAETLSVDGAEIDALYVQVGGGALASALAQGFAIAAAAGLAPRAPRLIAVQTAGCAPLARAWGGLDGVKLDTAARNRSRFMRPWGSVPKSLAHGILDDETYDWWEVVKAMRETEGEAIVADETAVAQALELVRANTDIPVSATGAAGLAGALVAPRSGATAAVLSGVERGGGG